MPALTCHKLAIWTAFAIALQIAGLSLFVFGFFPVKPALTGVSGPESYRPPADDYVGYHDVSVLSSDELRSLYTNLSQIPPPYARLILMVIDGLPAEFVLGKDGESPSRNFMDAMPYTHSLLKNGMAIGYHAKAAPPTVTMPRLKALVSGAISGFLDVAFNFNTQAFLDDNLLGQFFRIGWKMSMFGDNTWLKLFPQLFTRHDGVSSFFVKDTVQVDLNVTRHLPEELKQDDWHLLILHYLGLDHVGHVGGRKSILMAPKLKEMDDVIKMIHLNSILRHDSKETLLLVVSDHGMTESGNHGGSSYEETDSLALFVGQSFKHLSDVSETQQTINQVDITPTLAFLFGVPIPKNSVGVLAANCLHFLTGRQQLRALELNSWQLLRLLKAQLPGLSCADLDGPVDHRWSKVDHCGDIVEERLCCLYSKASGLHSLWKSTASSLDGGHHYNHTISAYYKFLMTASEWLTHKVTDKPIGRLASGILAMLLSCILFLRLLFCLRMEEWFDDTPGETYTKHCMQNWSLDEKFVVVVILIGVVSMGSSSMVEEEQYIWHFVTSTLFFILVRKTMQFLPLEGVRLSGVNCRSTYLQVSSVIVVLLSGRIMRGWHQGGVNWTHLPDIAKWLEQAGSNWIRAMEVLSGILITSMSLFVFSTMRMKRCFLLLIKVLYILSGYLILQHIMKYQGNLFLASGHGATFAAQLLYAVLGISSCFMVLASPWLSHLYFDAQSTSDLKLSVSQSGLKQTIHLVGSLKESSFAIGWTYILSWSLLQLLLQQPINLMPVFLLLLQISAAMMYFSNDTVGRKPWVEVAALYFMGMAGHFSLGNTNTLATIDVAGAFTGISSHSILLSGLLMFCITYASPMLVLLSLVMYISLKDRNNPGVDQATNVGLLLKSQLAIPLLVPLCINSVLLIAYTVVLLLMRNHLFVWSVFSPKYLYVCATTVCVYIGVCIVAATEMYVLLVCAFCSRRLIRVENSAEG